MAAKTKEELAQEFAQKALSAAPVIILGSGASIAHGIPGMPELAEHLRNLQPAAGWNGSEVAEWNAFVEALIAGEGLENALQSRRFTQQQTEFVATNTRRFLLPFDHEALKALFSNRKALPLAGLYRHLFDSTYPVIDVVTTNYDRLAEYAADAAEVSAFTGFNYGHLQTRASGVDVKIRVGGKDGRMVRIWKVHGSLDWFHDDARQIVAVPSALEVPDGHSPLMVTPGIDKYRLTHGEPFRTILSCSDQALQQARACFCIGYGFNDEHVQEKLIERCQNSNTRLVVITKQLTDAAKNFFQSQHCQNYLAIEEGPAGATAYMSDMPDGFELASPFWKLDVFLKNFIGLAT